MATKLVFLRVCTNQLVIKLELWIRKNCKKSGENTLPYLENGASQHYKHDFCLLLFYIDIYYQLDGKAYVEFC